MSSSSGGGDGSRRRSPFGGHLLEVVVCEFREDDGRTLRTVTLRELYDYILAAITNRDGMRLWELRRGGSVAWSGGVLATTTKVVEGSARIAAGPGPAEGDDGGGDEGETTAAAANGGEEEQEARPMTPRERLGGYLHPRDMRRLVTPFSASNAPALMVRRHAMLLNFDPLRAVVLRDRVLAVVSHPSDAPMLEDLERRLRGGRDTLERQLFGDRSSGVCAVGEEDLRLRLGFIKAAEVSCSNKKGEGKSPPESSLNTESTERGAGTESGGDDDLDAATSFETGKETDELDDINEGNWKNCAFELHAIDSILSTVCNKLSDDACDLRKRIIDLVDPLQQSSGSSSAKRPAKAPGELEQERLRLMKDKIKEMEARINGFVRAMDDVLDDDKDMALMNLSRLLTHPDRFVLPLSDDILEEEASEPEMVLEVYQHQALSMVQALDLLKGEIVSTEELLNAKMDILRNKLLFLNTMLALAALCVAIASLVGSIFGMNLLNGLESDENAFLATVVGTVVGALVLLFALAFLFRWFGVLPRVH